MHAGLESVLTFPFLPVVLSVKTKRVYRARVETATTQQ